MIKSVEELQSLVKWAEEAGLKQLKVDGIEFVFSDYQIAKRAMSELDVSAAPAATNAIPTKPSTEAKDTSKLLTDADPDAPKSIYDDPDLFHSTI